MLVVCLLAGVVLNVLVAMACARWGSEICPPFEKSIHDALIEPESVPDEAAAFISDAEYLKSLPDVPDTRLKKTWWASRLATRTMYTRAAPYDQRQGALGGGEFYNYRRVHGVHAFGFPLRSMCYVHHEGIEALTLGGEPRWRIPGWRGGWPLEPTGDIRSSMFTTTTIVMPDRPLGVSRIVYPGYVVYPLVPMPMGFAINSLLYGALVFGLFTLPGTVRRWLRLRRHQCESCGYPRALSPVCPECGVPHSGQGEVAGVPRRE